MNWYFLSATSSSMIHVKIQHTSPNLIRRKHAALQSTDALPYYCYYHQIHSSRSTCSVVQMHDMCTIACTHILAVLMFLIEKSLHSYKHASKQCIIIHRRYSRQTKIAPLPPRTTKTQGKALFYSLIHY